MGDGLEEFSPTPAEGRALIASGYRVPFTLLVRFENDAIDETPAVADVLQMANPAGRLRGWPGPGRSFPVASECIVACTRAQQGSVLMMLESVSARLVSTHLAFLSSCLRACLGVVAIFHDPSSLVLVAPSSVTMVSPIAYMLASVSLAACPAGQYQ